LSLRAYGEILPGMSGEFCMLECSVTKLLERHVQKDATYLGQLRYHDCSGSR
jgi:hypothetical protein